MFTKYYNGDDFNMKQEFWKDVKGYEGLYKVSNLGRVKALERKITYSNGTEHTYPEKLKSQVNSCGYLAVTLCKNGKHKQIKVHRLVAEAFLPNNNNLPQVNHKDENKHNNNVENLEWCSAKYNCKYGSRIKRITKNTDYSKMVAHQNYKEHGKKSSEKMSYPVGQYSLDGKLVRHWKSAREVQKELGWDRSYIAKCCRGVAETSHGYKWKYENN